MTVAIQDQEANRSENQKQVTLSRSFFHFFRKNLVMHLQVKTDQ
jgi:hypothetical protein